jgi:hypothetical protein
MPTHSRCIAVCVVLLLCGPAIVSADDQPPQKGEMAGYLLVPHEKVDKKYNAGFSMYVAAWPLLKNYPGQEFQSRLFGTWMFAQYDGPKPRRCTRTSKAASAGGGTPASPLRRRSSSWAGWP